MDMHAIDTHYPDIEKWMDCWFDVLEGAAIPNQNGAVPDQMP
jgi:hypothetical protein